MAESGNAVGLGDSSRAGTWLPTSGGIEAYAKERGCKGVCYNSRRFLRTFQTR